MMESSTYGSGDLYITNNRERITQELTARAEAQRAEAEMRRALLESYNSADNLNYTSIVADDYDSAYARRLYGFNSPTYRLPSSYYNLATSEAIRYASAYDPAFYNIMVSGDQVWVEPKYVTSMFGTWGATNVTFGIYSSPWIYGWGGYYPPSHYIMWGYPHYSWYDWNWNMCYNPYHWGVGYYAGCYPHYYGHHHSHHHPSYPPHYRPNNKPGVTDRFHTPERRNSASRYSSPTSSDRRGGKVSTTVRKGGATSSGINNSRVNRGSSSSGSRSSSVSRSTTTSGSSSNRSGSSSRTFRSSSTSVGSSVSSSSGSLSRSSSTTLRSSGSSSSSRSSVSSSSSSRSSGSSSSSSRSSRSSSSRR